LRASDLRSALKRLYPRCSHLEIENLVSAILSGKYWKVHSTKNDAYYVVALTRAKVPFKDGFMARSTSPWPVTISPSAARFCRRGRIMVIRREGNTFIARTVIEWPVFLRLMKMDESLVYRYLVENPDPPPFLNMRTFKATLQLLRGLY